MSRPLTADVLGVIEDKQFAVMSGSNDVENLKEYFEKQKAEYIQNEHKRKIFLHEKKVFKEFFEHYQGDKERAQKYLEKNIKNF